MKVLLLLNAPTPYRMDFCNELGKKVDLTVLYERHDSKDRVKEWHSRIKAQNFKEIFLKGIKNGMETAFCPGVIKYLKKGHYDLIEVGGYSTPTGMLAITYLVKHNIPFILNTDGGKKKNDCKIKYLIKRHFISKPDYYLSTSKVTDDYLINYGANGSKIFRYPFSSLKKSDILNELISADDKKKIRQKLGINYNKVIISVGRFIPLKGFDVLMQSAVKYNDDVGVYIVGGNPTVEYIKMKEKLGLNNVHFIDFMSKEKLKEYYLAADIFILPTRNDIWGLVINEAMAHGLPVITTDNCVAGLELIEDGKNGYIVPVDDAEAIYQSSIKLLEKPELIKKMAINNLKKISEYTIENMAIRHYEIYKNILKRLKSDGVNFK